MSDPVEEVVTEETPETRHPQPKNPPKMATITSKLKKYFGGSKKPQTVAAEIPAEGGSSGGDGSAPLVVTFTDASPASCDKTFSEIKAAYDAGQEIVAYCEYKESDRKWRIGLTVYFVFDSGELEAMEGTYYYIGAANYKYSAYCVISSNSIVANTTGFTLG